MLKRLVIGTVVAVAVVLVAIQAVPYGRAHTNPPVRREPAWPSLETRELAARACFDCHSNETTWPWYSNLAPASWLIQRDVDEGRRALNFSEWDRPQKEAREASATIREGQMPPWYYPGARLSSTDRDVLTRGLDVTLGGAAPRRGTGRGHADGASVRD